MGNKLKGPLPFQSIYQIAVKDIDGQDVSMSKYQNRVMLIVNVACEWGLTTKNYNQLMELDNTYSERGLSVLAFPCNQFFGQEPGTHEEIKSFVRGIGAKFDIFAKIKVNGKEACDLYRFLRLSCRLNGSKIGWNFGKFLVDRQGNVIQYYGPRTEPRKIVQDIERLL